LRRESGEAGPWRRLQAGSERRQFNLFISPGQGVNRRSRSAAIKAMIVNIAFFPSSKIIRHFATTLFMAEHSGTHRTGNQTCDAIRCSA
jgi:hypothetical protein